MHFGKLLRVTTSQMPEVEQILACYKACKKTIKSWPRDACGDADDSAFVHTLSTHLCTFNRKWEERELACKVRFAELQQQIATACTAEDTALLHGQVLNLHGDVLLMLHWSMLAYTGLVKILKKYHKRTGKLLHAPDMTGLLSHPFCSTEGMSHLVARVAALLQQLSEDLDLTVDAPGGPAVEAPAAAAAPSAAGSAADGNAAQQPVGASAATAAHTASAGLACESVQTALRPFQRCGGGDAASPHAAGRTDAWAEGSVRGGCRADSRRPGALAAGASEAAVVGPQSALSGSSAAGKRTAVEVRPLCSTLSAAQRCDSVASASGGGRVGALKRPRDESDSAQAAGPRPCCQAAEPTPEALGHTDAPARQSAAERGRDEANREEIWERLRTYTQRSNVTTNTRLIAQTQLALDTWQHIAHSKTPAPP